MITLDGLAYRAPDGRSLFENLTLAFGGERTGLLGANGAGKATLLISRPDPMVRARRT